MTQLYLTVGNIIAVCTASANRMKNLIRLLSTAVSSHEMTSIMVVSFRAVWWSDSSHNCSSAGKSNVISSIK